MTFVAEGFLEIHRGFVQTATKIVRESTTGFYEVTLATGTTVRHVAGKFLTFRSFSDEYTAPTHVERAKTYPARNSSAHDRTQRLYEQLTLW